MVNIFLTYRLHHPGCVVHFINPPCVYFGFVCACLCDTQRTTHNTLPRPGVTHHTMHYTQSHNNYITTYAFTFACVQTHDEYILVRSRRTCPNTRAHAERKRPATAIHLEHLLSARNALTISSTVRRERFVVDVYGLCTTYDMI